MPTKGERNALTFLAAVALLGAGTRIWRGARADSAPVDHAALTAHIAVVDSVRAKGRAPRAKGRGTTRPRASNPPRQAQPDHVADAFPEAAAPPRPRFPIDLDTAPRESIDELPGIGPVLAERIVAERIVNGPFGCMGALLSVKGIGAATARKLDTLVTFSGQSRRDPKLCDRQLGSDPGGRLKL